MKSLKKQNFERELPPGYRQALYINAKDFKLGVILNLISVAVLIIVMCVAVLILSVSGRLTFDFSHPLQLLIAYFVLFASMIGYIVLHELVHGIAYKSLTGERLTFGISWSCAFCGVPGIFTYRKTAIISVAAPLTVFTVLLLPLLAVTYFLSPLYYLVIAFIFGLHLGGCGGDIYVLILLITKFKNKKTLMRDTGPEQYFYLPIDKNDT